MKHQTGLEHLAVVPETGRPGECYDDDDEVSPVANHHIHFSIPFKTHSCLETGETGNWQFEKILVHNT